MKESLHWNENDLARNLREAQMAPEPGDWASMEALLDATGEGQAALPDPFPPPGPALPGQWAGWLLGGLLSGLLLLFVHAAIPPHQAERPSRPASNPGHPSEPVRDVVSSRGTIEASTITEGKLPLSSDNGSGKDVSIRTAAKAAQSPRNGDQVQGPPAHSGHDLAGQPGGATTQPAAAPFASSQGSEARPGLRTAARDFHDVPEDAYNIGLVAVSRLRKPMYRPVSDSRLTLPDHHTPPPVSAPRWRFGLASGVQMGTSPFDRAAPLSPWMGAQVRYELGGAWFLQSGFSAKWLRRRGIYGAELRDMEPNMSTEEPVSLRRADGLLVLEIPLLAGWQRGRWFAVGGTRIATGLAAGTRQTFSAEEFQNSASRGDLAASPNNPDLGLALGGGYFLHPSLCLELRYNHGLGVFLPAGAQDRIREVRHRDLQLGLTWWLGR